MKPFLFLSIAWLATSCGGLLQPQTDAEVGIDADVDSSIDIASDLAQDVAATDVVIDAFETCALSDGGAVRVPAHHRASVAACSTTRDQTTPLDAYGCGSNDELQCLTDADCTAGPNGRCNGSASYCYSNCSYDQCFSDADCANGGLCVCRASDSDTTGNYCVPAGNCTTDADCGPCGFCTLSDHAGCGMSPAFCGDVGSCEGYASSADGWVSVGCTVSCNGQCAQGYFCKTPQDGCTDDTDCDGFDARCAFVPVFQSWLCVGIACMVVQ